MYLTYEEYIEYGGTIDETTYNSIIYEAQAYIDWVTFNRLKKEQTIPVEVKRCVLAIISLVIKQQSLMAFDDTNKDVKSISNDGVSVSYNSIATSEVFTILKPQIKQTIDMYLSGIKNSEDKLLTYRGLYKDE